MFDADDLAAFVDTDMPGHAVATLGSGDVPGLFRKRPADAFGLVAGNRPSFSGVSESLSAVTVGSAVTIDAAYTVAGIQVGSAGMTTLELELA